MNPTETQPWMKKAIGKIMSGQSHIKLADGTWISRQDAVAIIAAHAPQEQPERLCVCGHDKGYHEVVTAIGHAKGVFCAVFECREICTGWRPAERRKVERRAPPVPATPCEQPEELIYLATPYTHPSKDVMESRFSEAARIAGALMADGHFVFCPITHTHPIAVRCELPRGWDFWERYDRVMLQACTKIIVVRMDGWRESKGIAGELKIAAELGKPVEYMDAAPSVPPGEETK